MFDTSQLRALEADLGKASKAVFVAAAAAVDESADELAAKWKANATATAGAHARKYPATITASRMPALGSIAAEAGPEARGQGNLGKILEYGAVHSAPHMDGNRAADECTPKFIARLEGVLAAGAATIAGKRAGR